MRILQSNWCSLQFSVGSSRWQAVSRTILQCPSMVEGKQFMSQDTEFYTLPVVCYHCVTILFLYEYIRRLELNCCNSFLKYSLSYHVVERRIYIFHCFPFEKQYISWQNVTFFPEGSEFLNICKIIHTWNKVEKQFVLGQQTKKIVLIHSSMCFFLRESECVRCSEFPFMTL